MEVFYTREEWLATRKDTLGSTDMTAILGVNPYVTPMDVYNEKKNGSTFSGNRATEIGTEFEPLIISMFKRDYNAEIIYQSSEDRIMKIIHPEYPFISVSPDFHASLSGELITGECKFTKKYVTNDNIEKIFPYWIYQANFNAAIAGHTSWILAYFSAPVGDFQYYEQETDFKHYEKCVAALVQFKMNLENNIQPMPIRSEDVENYFSVSADKTITADHHLESDIINALKYQTEKKIAEEKENIFKNNIKLKMLDAEFVISSSGDKYCSYKEQNRKNVDTDILKEKYPEIYIECLKETTLRQLRINEKAILK